MGIEQITTQVCIIGGGPGGVAASGYLTQNGIPHVLIEAAKFPRNKPCADTISIHVLNYIKELFPSTHKKLVEGKTLHTIKGLNIYAPNNSTLNFKYPNLERFDNAPSSYTIRRDVFDNFLFEAVTENELCTVYEGVKVEDIQTSEKEAQVITKDFSVSAEVVIVASGCNSGLASKITGNKKEDKHFAMGLRGYFENVKMTDEAFSELYINFNTFLGGFYVSALGDNKFNVNMVMKKGSINYQNLNYREHFFNHLESHPILKEKFKEAKLIGKIEGHGLMLGTKDRKVSDNRVLMVGDAAGIIDIVTANGIPQAFKSARLAVEVVKQAIQKNDYSKAALSDYEKILYKTLKNDLKAGRRFMKLYRTERSYKIALKIANISFKLGLIEKILSFSLYGFNQKKSK